MKPIFTRGDGYCSIHAVILAYSIIAKTILYNDKGEPLDDIIKIRQFLSQFILNNYPNNDIYISLIRDLETDVSIIEGDTIFYVLANLLNLYINVHYKNKKMIYYGKSPEFTIHITGDGSHYQAVIDDIYTKPQELPTVAQTWWYSMILDLDESVQERLLVTLQV